VVVTTINDETFNDHRRPHFCGCCLLLTTTFWLLTTTYPIVDTHFSCSGQTVEGPQQEVAPQSCHALGTEVEELVEWKRE
jgi:hypothetical protein